MKRLMIAIGLWWLFGLVVAGYTIPALQFGPNRSNPYRTEYEKMLFPVVRISSASGTGSGVIIPFSPPLSKGETGGFYILTAAHVVGNESVVQVTFYDEQDIAELKTASVVLTDTAKDLALLTTNSHELTRIYSARLSPSDYKYYLFTPVWAVGCSLGLNPRPSFGHITSCPLVSIRGYEISAPILPGNSGGPVYDARTYQVIGIAVWVRVCYGQLVTTMAGVVPINQIYEFLQDYERTKEPNNERTGCFSRSSVLKFFSRLSVSWSVAHPVSRQTGRQADWKTE